MNQWITSSYSSSHGGNCVEVRGHAYGVDVRDTQHREQGYLSVPVSEWAAFVQDARSGRL